eukprot:SAG22_NODE_1458_length_4379_cov_5.524766_2_plen_34_part_00
MDAVEYLTTISMVLEMAQQMATTKLDRSLENDR